MTTRAAGAGTPEAVPTPAELELLGLPALGPGIYVHVPFCASRCDYCAFATFTDRHHLAASYVEAVIEDYSRHLAAGLGSAWTVFLGGGTPSQLGEADLSRLLRAIDRREGAEVSVEANPEDVTPAWAAACAKAGVNRISLGVQSLDPAVLRGLGRRHDPAAVAAASASIAAAGIERYSVDLIYGGAGETDESWERTLAGVLELDPPPGHVSAYGLTVEPGTPLAADPGRHPDDDAQAARYEIAESLLGAAGYAWYEISNWALPGQASSHNLNYWVEGDYVGLGSAAHSHRAGERWWNVRTPDRYIGLVTSGASPVSGRETLPPTARHLESLELVLRTRAGVPDWSLEEALRTEPALGGLVELDERTGRLVLTLRGRLLANEVACRLRPDGLKHRQEHSNDAVVSGPSWPNRSSG